MNSSVEPQNTQNNEEELLNNVLQDIAQTTQKERTLFNKSLLPNHSDENSSKIIYEEEVPNVEQMQYNSDIATPVYNNHSGNSTNAYVSPTPMELLKESLKWSVIVAGLVFLFSRPTIVNNLAQYLPSKLLVEGGVGLNTFGAIFIAFLAGFLFFVLFHWII